MGDERREGRLLGEEGGRRVCNAEDAREEVRVAR